jgi:hypothetical protein
MLQVMMEAYQLVVSLKMGKRYVLQEKMDQFVFGLQNQDLASMCLKVILVMHPLLLV